MRKETSIVKDAMQRTLGPMGLAVVKEQEPSFMFSRGVNTERRSHTEDLWTTWAQVLWH